MNPKLANFNGNFDINVDAYTFTACGSDKTEKNFMNTIWLTSTGTRWWADNITLTLGSGRKVIFNGADNFNSNIVYLWSCIPCGDSSTNGFSLALGYDKNYDPANTNSDGTPVIDTEEPGYVISSYFIGRKTMARPVRGIRELK